MNIIDHGHWEIYTAPDELLERRNLTRQHGVVFSRKQGTNEDWYDYCARFTGTVIITTTVQPDGLITGAANTNFNFIFPANGGLIEITDYAGSDPEADFSNKIYDPVNKTFTPRPPMTEAPELMEMRETIKAMQAQITKLMR